MKSGALPKHDLCVEYQQSLNQVKSHLGPFPHDDSENGESDPVVPKKTLHACDAHVDMLGVFAESEKLCEQKGGTEALDAGWIVMPTCWAFLQSPESYVNRNVMLGLSMLGGLPCRHAGRFRRVQKAV